jgi:hypothetical protein
VLSRFQVWDRLPSNLCESKRNSQLKSNAFKPLPVWVRKEFFYPPRGPPQVLFPGSTSLFPPPISASGT